VPFNINHIHLKAPDPEKTANWYVKAFNFEIVADTVRDSGDRFIRCRSENGIPVNISAARTGEAMGQGDANAHYGIEHFGFDTDDIEADIKRLEASAPSCWRPDRPARRRAIAFIKVPDDVRIELIQSA